MVKKAVSRKKHKIADIQGLLEKKDVTLSLMTGAGGSYPIKRVKDSPCKVACPAGIEVKGYNTLIAARKYKEALELIRRNCPLPGVCGRVCFHPCEYECARIEIDEPVAINDLKRFVVDYSGASLPSRIKRTRKEKVAIVGSGPAGLSAGYYLIKMGYGVTVFEKLSLSGGMLITGIPTYRLPREIVDDEINYIKALGVEIKTGITVGKDITLKRLKQQGYQAIFLAVGAHRGLKLGIEGEDDFEGIIEAITFLREANLEGSGKTGRRVLVIGGGNSAVDAARSSLRLGSRKVNIVYRRSRSEMPADPNEVEEAEREGVKIIHLTQPVRVLGKEGKVTGVECLSCRLGSPDRSGRRRPIPIKGSEFTVETDCIIPAIGQEPDVSFLPRGHGFELSEQNSFIIDPETMQTNRAGIFAGGDAVTGPASVIEAIAAGHRAAQSIDSYLVNKGSRKKIYFKQEMTKTEETELVVGLIKRGKRQQPPSLPVKKRLGSFTEVIGILSEKKAVMEAGRCLKCGPCSECYQCVETCEKRHAVLSIPGSDRESMLLRLSRSMGEQVFESGLAEGEIEGIPVKIERITSRVEQALCRGCGRCVEVCEYSAPSLIDKGEGVRVSSIDQNICRGCGVCASICPSRAIRAGYFNDGWINGTVEALLNY
ncbi:MAG: FAD-dependent oxidoreductase [Deltaproteobacteria bacterium]|nr:MAG: FAD-dependent oxidoreductase [Deltaproteobacteria bacterium]